MNIVPQNSLSSFESYFNEKKNLKVNWRVALSADIFPSKKTNEKQRIEFFFFCGLEVI